ncbi:MAG: lipopolysaccharide transport periplasmic protein LptA [Pseudomonadota bacterium]
MSSQTRKNEPTAGVRGRVLLALFGCLTIIGPSSAIAQLADLRLPISLDADATDYDGKSSMLMFEGLRLTQGNIGVQADKGLASKLDFEDAVWQFTGNVVIDTENGHIECDTADLRFSGHQLTLASITGSPASFTLQREGVDEVTEAQAGRLTYDFAAGIVEFADDAVITEGGNQISSDYLVYNIKEQRINAQSAGEGQPRVKITYTPRAADLPSDAELPSGIDLPPGVELPSGVDVSDVPLPTEDGDAESTPADGATGGEPEDPGDAR